MNGRSTSGTTGLGTVDVSGRRRVPSPADEDHGLHALTWPPAPDALVGQPGGADGRRGRARCARRSAGCPRIASATVAEVELLELVPLGDEHDRVGALDDLERAGGELDAR